MLASSEQKQSIKDAILGVCDHAVKVSNVPKDDFTFLRSNFSADVRAFLKRTSGQQYYDPSESMQLSNFFQLRERFVLQTQLWQKKCFAFFLSSCSQ